MKDSLKQTLEAENQNVLPQPLGNTVVHIQATYRKDRMKAEGAYFEKKNYERTDRQTDGQTDDGRLGMG